MGNIGIKINGEWVDLMSAFVPCQLCNEPVQIKELQDIKSDSINGIVTWQCKQCHAVMDRIELLKESAGSSRLEIDDVVDG